ncbi:TRAP transporter small permease [Geminicoccus roseus]|uniref:TRAP transporter small permease n=1 Tax=Geminicoccus roseus TaxID=404900 RepID=UPI00042491A3|nr:TRAP transporter small permease [Geminicoccus roseus]
MRAVLDDAEKLLCALILLAMTVLGFLNIIVRYLTSYSFAATEEILINGFLLLTIFGAAIAARRGEHLAVTLVFDMLPGRGRQVLLWLSTGLSVLLMLLSAWYCFQLVQNQFQSGVVSPGLQVPAWYYTVGLPLGFLLIVVRLVQHAIRTSRQMSGQEAGHHG